MIPTTQKARDAIVRLAVDYGALRIALERNDPLAIVVSARMLKRSQADLGVEMHKPETLDDLIEKNEPFVKF